MTDRIRVVMPFLGRDMWMGGLSYQSNLVEAIRRYAPHLEMCVLLPSNPSEAAAIDERTLRHIYPRHGLPIRGINWIMRRVTGYDFLLGHVMRGAHADVAFSPSPYFVKELPTLYWIPDFQHVHLPEMFAAVKIRRRNSLFRQAAKRAGLVVLSSRDALRDFCRLFPESATKARVMSFVAYVSPEIYDLDPATVVAEYSLPKRFIYLPNQFWKHKNHITVLEALRLLRSRGIVPFVVFTGGANDRRHPTFFSDLMQMVSDWGLNEQIRYLGVVPKSHVHLLMRQTICILNPSLFEGWSTTVEEAKSIGKRVLLSELTVHREQNAPKATYFDPTNAEDLAMKMAKLWADGEIGPDRELESQARDDLPRRMRAYAETFVCIVREAISIARGSMVPMIQEGP